MKKIFIAGKYSADNIIDVLTNIRVGMQESVKVIEAGFAPFCPWLDHQYAHYADLPKEVYQQISIEWLKVSDGVYMTPGWTLSTGAIREHHIAIDLKIPVFYNIEEMVRFFRYKDMEKFFKEEPTPCKSQQ